MKAAANGHVDIVKVLLAHRPDLNESDHDGSTALVLARSHGYTDIAELLKRAGARE
jgi:ankyrin repeat protein